jgi:hypothetical protein
MFETAEQLLWFDELDTALSSVLVIFPPFKLPSTKANLGVSFLKPWVTKDYVIATKVGRPEPLVVHLLVDTVRIRAADSEVVCPIDAEVVIVKEFGDGTVLDRFLRMTQSFSAFIPDEVDLSSRVVQGSELYRYTIRAIYFNIDSDAKLLLFSARP